MLITSNPHMLFFEMHRHGIEILSLDELCLPNLYLILTFGLPKLHSLVI